MATIRQLQGTLKLTFGIVPIVAGADKFTNLLTHWVDYLNKSLVPFDPLVFMKIVGVIEIVAGIIVLVRPLIGAYIVMAWLICIALQLIASGHYLDVAVRDLVMAIGAYTLAQLTRIEEGRTAEIR
jgi:energy-converting hydrogenase Eha subunit C